MTTANTSMLAGFDVIRKQRGQCSIVAANLPKNEALSRMRNLKRRAIDGHTNVYFSIAPHTA